VLMDAFMGKVSLGRTALPQGTLVTAGIRAESLVLSQTAGEGLQATVDLVEELGGSRVAYCTLAGQEISVTLPPGDQPLEGKTVWLTLPPATIHLYDRLSGLRIEETVGATAVGITKGDRIIA